MSRVGFYATALVNLEILFRPRNERMRQKSGVLQCANVPGARNFFKENACEIFHDEAISHGFQLSRCIYTARGVAGNVIGF
jgi:hypothetical protein